MHESQSGVESQRGVLKKPPAAVSSVSRPAPATSLFEGEYGDIRARSVTSPRSVASPRSFKTDHAFQARVASGRPPFLRLEALQRGLGFWAGIRCHSWRHIELSRYFCCLEAQMTIMRSLLPAVPSQARNKTLVRRLGGTTRKVRTKDSAGRRYLPPPFLPSETPSYRRFVDLCFIASWVVLVLCPVRHAPLMPGASPARLEQASCGILLVPSTSELALVAASQNLLRIPSDIQDLKALRLRARRERLLPSRHT